MNKTALRLLLVAIVALGLTNTAHAVTISISGSDYVCPEACVSECGPILGTVDGKPLINYDMTIIRDAILKNKDKSRDTKIESGVVYTVYNVTWDFVCEGMPKYEVQLHQRQGTDTWYLAVNVYTFGKEAEVKISGSGGIFFVSASGQALSLKDKPEITEAAAALAINVFEQLRNTRQQLLNQLINAAKGKK